ncbi:MFS transporter [Streptomyces sp. NBC_01237]|uniref:MFS transporter n=1 Tax=Streptomyces sp. NBC_01237 TaxID=2903790 RepID=UPI002DD7D002|nr:MFS transporter [Streptomyces sp. NBC_01237]WRZ74117.1 MFS transporter [Streptomyces sp. NBC_01237]
MAEATDSGTIWRPPTAPPQRIISPSRAHIACGRAETAAGRLGAFGVEVSRLIDALKARGLTSRWSSGALQGTAVCVAGTAMASFPFVDASGPRLLLIGMTFGCTAVAIPPHYMTTAEVVPTAQRGAVFGIVAATGTLPGLIAPSLTGHLIDAATTQAAGYRTAFLVTAVVMVVAGAFAVAAIRPEHDARRLASAPGPRTKHTEG